ncbi:hypothetical protein L209DRAFT_4242 [Thermothelomyces heterothallicus CBS 203.75]
MNQSCRSNAVGGWFCFYGNRLRIDIAPVSRNSRASLAPRGSQGPIIARSRRPLSFSRRLIGLWGTCIHTRDPSHRLSIALLPWPSPQPLGPLICTCGRVFLCFKPSYWMGAAGPETAADGRIGAMHDACPPGHSGSPARSARSGALAATGHSLFCSRTCSCMPNMHHGCTTHAGNTTQ